MLGLLNNVMELRISFSKEMSGKLKAMSNAGESEKRVAHNLNALVKCK